MPISNPNTLLIESPSFLIIFTYILEKICIIWNNFCNFVNKNTPQSRSCSLERLMLMYVKVLIC